MATKSKKMSSMPSSVQAATAAMAIAGRATRACDVCGIQRARWYCGADEAYLCANCDTTVHGANALALRHDRVRLAPHGTPVQKSFKRSSSVLSKHSSINSDVRVIPSAASPSDHVLTERKQQVLEALQTPETTPPMVSDFLDCKAVLQVPQQSIRVREQAGGSFPARKRSRTSRPHPHHLRRASSHGGGEGAPRYKIQKSGSCGSKQDDAGMVQVKIESVMSDFMSGELQELMTLGNDDEDENAQQKRRRTIHGGAHEVPTFITVVQDGHESPGLSAPAGFLEGHSRVSSDCFSPNAIFKGKAAQAHAAQEGRDLTCDDTDQFLVPDCFDNCAHFVDSSVDICCDVDGKILLVEDDSTRTVKEEGGGKDIENFGTAFSGLKTDQLGADSGASAEFESTDFGSTDFASPDFGPSDIMCDEFGLDFDFPGSISSESAFEGDSTAEDQLFLDQAHGAAAKNVAAATEFQNLVEYSTTPGQQILISSSGEPGARSSPFTKFLPEVLVKLEGVYSGTERSKKEAQEILRCSLESLSEEELRQVPSLRLDYDDVLNAWSDRGAFWMPLDSQYNSAQLLLLNPDVDSTAAVILLKLKKILDYESSNHILLKES